MIFILGIAALHVGGMTVHSFAGTGKGEDGVLDLKEKVKRRKRTRKHWMQCETLVIDEVSMVYYCSFFPPLWFLS